MGEGALKVAIHRMRKRFRAAIRREIAQTLQGETEVEGEFQYLLAVLSSLP